MEAYDGTQISMQKCHYCPVILRLTKDFIPDSSLKEVKLISICTFTSPQPFTRSLKSSAVKSSNEFFGSTSSKPFLIAWNSHENYCINKNYIGWLAIKCPTVPFALPPSTKVLVLKTLPIPPYKASLLAFATGDLFWAVRENVLVWMLDGFFFS